MNKGDTCVLVTTFLRDDLLFRCVESIRKFYPAIPIFIGDNGKESLEKKRFCNKHKCIFFRLPFDLGVGGTRNESLKKIPKEYKYIAVIEDDIVFTEGTKLEKWKAILEKNKDIGIVGGLLKFSLSKHQHYEALTWIDGDTHYIKKADNPSWQETDGTRFFLCDMILNVFMMKRLVWEKVQWDPQFKTALEHADFFMRLKYKSKKNREPVFDKNGNPIPRKRQIRIAYAPDVWMFHKQETDNSYYRRYRTRPVGWQLFGQKWNVRYSHSDYNKTNPICYDLMGEPFSQKDENLELAIRILEGHECKWWLEAGTCLGYVRDKNFIAHDPDIDIGLLSEHINLWNSFIEEFKEVGFDLQREWKYKGKPIELSFRRKGVKLDLFFFSKEGHIMWHGAFGPNKHGDWMDDAEFLPHVFSAELFDDLQEVFFRGKRCFIPNPPERYLFERYGKGWQTPDVNYKFWKHCKAIDRNFMNKKKRKVFIGGVWDIFHIGHLNILERAKKLGDELTVGVLTDEATEAYKQSPVFPFEQRKRIIESLSVVDKAITQNDRNPTEDFKKLRYKPHYIIHGDDWDECPSEDYVKKKGGKSWFLPYTEGISTSDIKKRIIASDSRKIPKKNECSFAVGIKTFLREETFLRTLKALKKYFPYDYKLYIADDGKISDEKEYLYQKLETEGHKIFRLPFASGISVGRNKTVQSAKEDYILIMDDDIALVNSETIKNMKAILESDEDIGLCSGMIYTEVGINQNQHLSCENYQKGLRFEWTDEVLFRHPAKKIYHDVNGIKYLYADQVVNFFLAKREVFKDVLWDNRIRIEYEHMDFFAKLQKTKWKVVSCVDTKAMHLISRHDSIYNRHRRSFSSQYFFQKHGIHAVINKF